MESLDQHEIAALQRAAQTLAQSAPQISFNTLREFISQKYALTDADNVDLQTGAITRGKQAEA